MLLYKSFVASNFHYCPLSWMFCGKKNSDKLEKIQERALRFVYSDFKSDYNVLLSRDNMLSLARYRLYFMAIEMYKCANHLNPEYLNDLFEFNKTPYDMRDPNRIKQPKFSTVRYGYKSFTYYGAKLWNAIPGNIKTVGELSIFKAQIKPWCLSSECDDLIVY